jgi:hypothetical protein
VSTVTDDRPEADQAQPEDERPTGQPSEEAAGLVRRQDFDADAPLDIDVSISSGRVTINLVDEPGASVEVRHDPSAESSWMHGLASVMNWVNDRFGDAGMAQAAPAEVVERTRIELIGKRLVVHTGRGQFGMTPLELVPVAVTVRAPVGSQLELRSGSAIVTVTGQAGRVTVSGGAGDVAIDRADGRAQIKVGSGALRLGPMLGGLDARSGTGEIEVSSVGGPTTLVTGSGDVWLGAVQSDVMARTGSGDLVVADAACGDVELITGSGEIRVGVRPGTRAMVDLRSGSGQARSELNVHDRPQADAPRLRVRGRTGSGNAVITTAAG